MRLIFFGSGEFGLPTLDALTGGLIDGREEGHEVLTVVTQPDRPAGRGRKNTPTPVRAWCEAHAVPVLPVERVNETPVVAELLGLGAELGVVVAFGQKIGPAILEGLPGGCINLHASLLPKYRGASPINRAVISGETETGVTVFRLVERMDAGPILTAAPTAIGETETAGELHDRLAWLGPKAVADALALFRDGAVPPGEPQDESQATAAPKLKKADGVIDWSQPAERVARLVHGLCPWPGATTTFTSAGSGKSEPVTLLRVRVTGGEPPGDPGSLTDEFVVRCGTGALAVVEIKPANSRAMAWRDFVNGRRVTARDRFGQEPGGTPGGPDSA